MRLPKEGKICHSNPLTVRFLYFFVVANQLSIDTPIQSQVRETQS